MMRAKPNFKQALEVKRAKVVMSACIFAGQQTQENCDTLLRAVHEFHEANRAYEIAYNVEGQRRKGKR